MQDAKESMTRQLDQLVKHPIDSGKAILDASIDTIDKVTSNPEDAGKFIVVGPLVIAAPGGVSGVIRRVRPDIPTPKSIVQKLAPSSGGKNLFWHGSAEGVENATKNGLFAHGTGNGSKFWATSRGEQGKLTEILIGGNYNIVAKPPFVQYKGGFGAVYKLTAEEASHFSKAWGFQYSWNPYQWYKGVSGQYYFHPGTVSWAQRATELKRGAAITTAVGVGTWGLVELNDWWNGR